jgi:hypothetical protein
MTEITDEQVRAMARRAALVAISDLLDDQSDLYDIFDDELEPLADFDAEKVIERIVVELKAIRDEFASAAGGAQ